MKGELWRQTGERENNPHHAVQQPDARRNSQNSANNNFFKGKFYAYISIRWK
jgi:hypothetical protein